MKKIIYLLICIVVPIFGSWDYSVSKDEMTGKNSAYASSQTVAATKRMDFPYSKTRGWIGIGCFKCIQFLCP